MMIPLWAIPALLTVIIWVTATLWPKGDSGGSCNFGPALMAAFCGLLAIIGTLFVWLVFFIVF